MQPLLLRPAWRNPTPRLRLADVSDRPSRVEPVEPVEGGEFNRFELRVAAADVGAAAARTGRRISYLAYRGNSAAIQ